MSSVGLVSDRIGARGGYCGRIDRARVLYYFPTKEQLLMATLERRFELRRSRAEAIGRDSGVVAMMRFHLEAGLAKPGMMRLFITLAVAATDPDHPAHNYFLDRYQRTYDQLRAGFAADIEAGRTPRTVDPTAAAVRIIALCDGLQVQYLLRDGTC
jgi:AcrR family transcriptional regulator